MPTARNTMPSHPVLSLTRDPGAGRRSITIWRVSAASVASSRSSSSRARTWSRWPRQPCPSGADVIGMAGGDGSQGVVAAVAAAHDLPYVCVPAGTRNHFATSASTGAT